MSNFPGGKLGLAAAGLLGAAFLDARYYISRDVKTIAAGLGLQRTVTAYDKAGLKCVIERFLETAAKYPKNKVIVARDEASGQWTSWTYEEVDKITNRLAHFYLALGVKPMENVALLFENKPEILFHVLALWKVGAVPAMQNFNLRGKALAHCLTIVRPRFLILGDDEAPTAAEIASELKELGIRSFQWTTGTPEASIGASAISMSSVGHYSDAPIDREIRRGIDWDDTGMIIYTSGTTGLPKAALVTQNRLNMLSMSISTMTGYPRLGDVIYCPQPLYHSAGLMAFFLAFKNGGALAIGRRFSARNFYRECAESGATGHMYIGEICRYLLATPPSEWDKKHKVEFVIGNGLRADIWKQFYERFNKPVILEFYGSTEGNASGMIKYAGQEEGFGSVSHAGPLQRALVKQVRLLKFDVDTEEPVRDPKTGFCIDAAPDEPGEVVGLLKEGDDNPFKSATFKGYLGDQKANDKKILKDVFVKGDKYFRMGDLMKRDKNGYLYFVDRIGDTFRWRGENVSTMEVGNVLMEHPAVQEANVYGVKVPGWDDGRAGMAAITLKPEARANERENMASLGVFAGEKLPKYAVPIFIRVQPEMEITGTFKHRKVEMQKDGIDPAVIKDTLYWYEQGKGYVPFGRKEYQEIVSGKAKL
ncbi:hypothetical protein DFJ74DRAFT_662726 [Hyaloraphidium curvatum]|nr:hypothetical protein DFJ74DRAFT_662726 [Hyaloraphidium curvatum]